jgi:hypothetical protein
VRGRHLIRAGGICLLLLVLVVLKSNDEKPPEYLPSKDAPIQLPPVITTDTPATPTNTIPPVGSDTDDYENAIEECADASDVTRCLESKGF